MRNIYYIIKRELIAYLFSPLAYVVITIFLLINGLIFWMILGFMNQPDMPPEPPMKYFFTNEFFWIFMLFITPIITMRLISEERNRGTLETLLTAPITDTQVILGKYISAMIFFILIWIPTLVYVLILYKYGRVDIGPIVGGYIGILLIGGNFIAIGLFCSTLSRNQIVSAIITFLFLIIFFSLGLLEWLVKDIVLKHIFSYINMWMHMIEMSKGIIDTRIIVYYLSGIVLFLFLSVKSLESNRWR